MFFTKRTLDELRAKLPREELIRRSRILVIDDERPDLIDDLKGSGFAVDHQTDITSKNLSVINQPLYDLVILDFGNVGTTLGSEQGLSILKHIKRTNPATLVLAYTSKALTSEHARFYTDSDGVLAKDAGIADSLERIEEALQLAHSVENVWKGLLNLSGVPPGSSTDKAWQDLAVRALSKPARLVELRSKITAVLSDPSAQKIGLILLEKIIEIGVKRAIS